tara:strand:+ start:9591 stop:10727 length:1137 start_codon:yes stop_codon:yes gene_type:complete
MKFTDVKSVDSIESKSTQEIEQDLLTKHEDGLQAQEVNENSDTIEIVVPETKELPIEEKSEEIQDLPELKDEDVLSYIKSRYNKDISSVDDLFAQSESNEELPDDVSKYLKFKKETGRGFQDFVNANKDYTELSDDKLLKEYYSLTETDLDTEDIEYLMEDKYGYDEDIDDERDIKKKKISKKRELATARKYLSEISEAYKIPLESSGGSLNEDDRKDYSEYKEKVQEARDEMEANKKRAEFFSKKTDEVFNSEFKGFEFNIGEKNIIYSSGDANEIKSKQINVQNFINEYVDSEGIISNAKGWHKALNAAMNPDKLAQYFYDQGKADAIGDVSKKSKNINMDLRQTPQGTPQAGFKAKAINDTSGKGLRIRSSRKNN